MPESAAMPPQRTAAVFVALLSFFAVASPAAEPAAGTFDANGVKIRYFVHGEGEPVVLIHGLFASAWLNWELPGITTAIAKDHQVIALDLPAYGGSDKPEKPEAYGPQLAEDVVLLLDHLNIKKAHFVGYSLGGMITMKLLTLHPERVLSATVGGMGWVQEGGRNLGLRERMGRPPNGPMEMLINSMGKLGITEDALKAIKPPVTVVIGDKDPVKGTVGPLRRVRPDWPVVEIKDAGHMNCVLKKDFTDAIVKWLEKNRQD
jgi:pimeloyl-ACP methyl ester carboxylesterase